MRVVYESQLVLLEIERALEWWRANRDKAPDALESDLEQAIDDLETRGAMIGTPVRHARLSNVRRLHLRRARFFLYFRLSADHETIAVLSLWHASRGTTPLI